MSSVGNCILLRGHFLYFFKYNQQDATLYNIFVTVNALHVIGDFSARHQELRNCICQKQTWHISDGVFTVFELLMMGGEIAWNM